ncbi:MAG: hypothetical protein MZW92_62970 [Comamonadaceae bacterium]|nr:hypothetical protein [Comamonadaceae bacterium]
MTLPQGRGRSRRPRRTVVVRGREGQGQAQEGREAEQEVSRAARRPPRSRPAPFGRPHLGGASSLSRAPIMPTHDSTLRRPGQPGR